MSAIRESKRRYNVDGSEWTLKQLDLEAQAKTFAQRWCSHVSGGAFPQDLRLGYDAENWLASEGTSFGSPELPIVELVLDWEAFGEQGMIQFMNEPEIIDDSLDQWEDAVKKVALKRLKNLPERGF